MIPNNNLNHDSMEITNNLQAAHVLREWAKDFKVIVVTHLEAKMKRMSVKVKQGMALDADEIFRIHANVTNAVPSIRNEARELITFLSKTKSQN